MNLSYATRNTADARLRTMANVTSCCDDGHIGRCSSSDRVILRLRRRRPLCANLGFEMAETPQIYVGTAGWSYKDWEGIVYPAQIKKSQHPVEFLARYLDVLEINTSFYGHVKPEWGKLWSRMARAVNPAVHVHRQAQSRVHPLARSR